MSLVLSTDTVESPIKNTVITSDAVLFIMESSVVQIRCQIGLAISPKWFLPSARKSSSVFSSSPSSSISTLLPWRFSVSKTSVMGLVDEVEGISAVSVCVPIADRCCSCVVSVLISNIRCDDCGVCVPISSASILGWGGSVFFSSLEMYCPLILCAEKTRSCLWMLLHCIFVRNTAHLSYGCRLLFTTRLELFDFVFKVFFYFVGKEVCITSGGCAGEKLFWKWSSETRYILRKLICHEFEIWDSTESVRQQWIWAAEIRRS